jgi:hypothetical protein
MVILQDLKPSGASRTSAFRAFSGEVDTGSPSENAVKHETL